MLLIFFIKNQMVKIFVDGLKSFLGVKNQIFLTRFVGKFLQNNNTRVWCNSIGYPHCGRQTLVN